MKVLFKEAEIKKKSLLETKKVSSIDINNRHWNPFTVSSKSIPLSAICTRSMQPFLAGM